MRIVVVGAGPWGLAVLDRLVARARRGAIGACEVVLIDLQPPGRGVHSPDLHPGLLLNTESEEIDAFGAAAFGEAPVDGARGFRDWLESTGASRAEASGFVPRRCYGRYLGFVRETLRRAASPGLRVRFVRGEVVDLRRGGAREVVVLDTGGTVAADLVLLCTGHGVDAAGPRAPGPGAPGWLPPYPVEAFAEAVPPGAALGVAGLGLVAVDVVAALSEGRGGRFVPAGEGRVDYVPSGSEPVIHLFSRGGLPFCCRPGQGLRGADAHRPALFTPEAIAARRAAAPEGRLDFERDVLPLLFGEMEALHRRLAGPQAGPGAIDPRELFYARRVRAAGDAGTYRARFLARLRHDLAECLKGEAGSPYKAAMEGFRTFQDTIRAAVEFGGLTPASHRAFRSRVVPRINQIAVGPPVARGMQLVALVEAGIVRLDLGPGPLLRPDGAGGWRAESRAFDPPFSVRLDAVVRGFLRNGGSLRSDRLFRALRASGRARAAALNEGPPDPAEIDLSPEHALRDAAGRDQPRVRVLGVPGEGATYFNHYLPSRGGRARAFHAIERVLESALRGSGPAAAERERHPLA